MMIKSLSQIILFVLILTDIVILNVASCTGGDEISISAPLYTDSAGLVGQKAAATIFRIVCVKQGRMGTGFLHKSGSILTAAHVVANCEANDVMIVLPQGTNIPIKNIISDEDNDIASLTPTEKVSGDSLPITNNKNVKIGTQVSTWGFPSGYTGRFPMLSVGYLSGLDAVKTPSGKIVRRLVVNAAFNSGNSGGPLIDIESGTVIGIVSGKLAPIPPDIEKALEVLRNVEIGVGWDFTKPDGTKGKISQSQLLEKILQYMRSQTQLVVGRAVLPDQLREFLKANGLDKEM